MLNLESNVTLAILAGGEGRRMGQAKGLLEIAGQPILRHLLASARWSGPTMLVTAPGREHPPGWEAFDREVADPVAGLGPLRGLLTALENVATPLLLVATVDMPGIQHDHLRWLLSEMTSRSQSLGLMLQRRESLLIEPFPSIYRLDAIDVVREHMNDGRRSVQGLLKHSSFQVLPAPADWDPSTWANLNTPQDLPDAGSGSAADGPL